MIMMMMMMVVAMLVPVFLPVVGAGLVLLAGTAYLDIDIGERDLETSRASERTRLAYICTPSSLTCLGSVSVY